MNVLIVGSGGREHVLAWKIQQSPLVKKIFCAPGNGGIAEIAQCVDIRSNDTEGLIKFAKDKQIDLTVVGPESPLVTGIVDRFEHEHLKIFGPSKKASQLEGSKSFAKDFMHRWNIPTASYKTFTDPDRAKEYLKELRFPLVVKADGLASGKGVTVCQNLKEAETAVQQAMEEKIFQGAGLKIIIEECLQGEELSVLAISDGQNYVVLDSAQDHKRIFDDDLGPNTGGMGAYSPVPIVNREQLNIIDERIIEPVIRGMRRESSPFKGVLYAGLMITLEGPMVLEFNVRFGDPEAQALLPRLKNDLVEIMLAGCEGRMNEIDLEWDKRSSVCVVLSSGGYPGKYEIDKEIAGLQEASAQEDAFVFHAGTRKENNRVFTSAGRVLNVVGLGKNIEQAIDHAYAGVEKVKFDRCFFRRDIGAKAIKKVRRPSKSSMGRR